ncbi:hypothetical protein Gotur_024437 [Gossypium turneri]
MTLSWQCLGSILEFKISDLRLILMRKNDRIMVENNLTNVVAKRKRKRKERDDGVNNSRIYLRWAKDYHFCIDWIEDVMRVLDMKATADFITMLWNRWNNCNKFIFRGKEDDASVVWDRAKTQS